MLFNLLIGKFEHLKAILICCLCSLCLSEVVHNAAIRECLFDILVCKKDNQITIWICLTTDSIGKNDFLLPRLINSLYLAIMTDDLLNYFLVLTRLFVIFIAEL